jgi:hypothetical protein
MPFFSSSFLPLFLHTLHHPYQVQQHFFLYFSSVSRVFISTSMMMMMMMIVHENEEFFFPPSKNMTEESKKAQ